MRIQITALAATLMGFSSRFLLAAPPVPTQPANLKAEVHQILRERACGVCHIPPGVPAALNVFDLNEELWYTKLSLNQLSQFKWRVRAKGDEIKAMRGTPEKHQFTAEEIALVEEFVDVESKERQSRKLPFLK